MTLFHQSPITNHALRITNHDLGSWTNTWDLGLGSWDPTHRRGRSWINKPDTSSLIQCTTPSALRTVSILDMEPTRLKFPLDCQMSGILIKNRNKCEFCLVLYRQEETEWQLREHPSRN